MEKALLEYYLDQGLSLPQIGVLVNRHPSTVGYWVQKHGLVPNGRDKFAPRGGLTRSQLQKLLAQRMSLAEIAEGLDVSVATVRYWLDKYGLRTIGRGRRQRAGEAAEISGLREATMTCSRHGLTEFALQKDGDWRCLKCRREAVVRWRRNVKRKLVEEAGGRCCLCGYDRCLAALQFHHLDPNEKSFGLSRRGLTRSFQSLREEARKCVLLCANCHAEVEAGLVEVKRLPIAA